MPFSILIVFSNLALLRTINNNYMTPLGFAPKYKAQNGFLKSFTAGVFTFHTWVYFVQES